MRAIMTDDQIKAVEQHAGHFSLLLVKALVSTGTYAPGHPMARAAAADMYKSFNDVTENVDELTYLLLSTIDDEGILVEGLLDEPIPIKKVFRGIMGDHFLGKFHDYFARNRIASFSIKSGIAFEHFEIFLGCLTTWTTENSVGHRSAEEFSSQLLEMGVYDVSIISMDEVVGGNRHLAWSVKIALSRMRKDISKLPMLRGADRAEIHRLKIGAITDIMRPLTRVDLQRDLLINADLVADGIHITSVSEIQDTLVMAMSSSSAFAIAEMLMVSVEQLNSSSGRTKIVGRSLDELFETSTVCLAKLLSKLAMVEYKVAFPLMEIAYRQDMIALDELPQELQKRLRAGDTTDKFLSNSGKYLSDFDTCTVPQDYLKYLNIFSIVLPELVVRDNRPMVSSILGLIARHLQEPDVLFHGRGRFISEGISALNSGQFMTGLIEMAIKTPKEERAEIEIGIALFGDGVVPALIGYLISDSTPSIRGAASSILLRIGPPAVEPLTDELRAHRHGWQSLRWIIKLLGQLKASGAEKNIFQYSSHPHPKVREECLSALYEILGPDSEKHLIEFIRDSEPMVARRAISLLSLLHSTNPKFLDFLYQTIKVRSKNQDEPDDKVQAVCLRALGEYTRVVMPKVPNIEEALQQMLSDRGFKALLPGKMGLRKKSSDIKALAVTALAARGGHKNQRFIESLLNSDDEQVTLAANKAVKNVEASKQEMAESLSE